jgi:hypothetical protein
MVTIKIFIYYSKPGLLNSILVKFLNKTCSIFFCPQLYMYKIIERWGFKYKEYENLKKKTNNST